MEQIHVNEPLIVLVIGVLVMATVFMKSHSQRVGVPSLVAFVLLGLCVRLVDGYRPFLSEALLEVLDVLGKIGIIALLFRIGLESDLKGLASKLRSASVVWVVNVLGSGAAGYLACAHFLGASLSASLFVGVAMTATSVGVSVGAWKEAGALSSETGELLLDVVELDDLSGVILMSILFGVANAVFGAASADGAPESGCYEVGVVLQGVAVVVAKLVAFFLACYLFMRYVERPFTRYVEKTEKGPRPMLMMVGVSFVLAAVAGFLGFSVAIGGFFAGLIFSQDREAVKLETSFESLYEFFAPFFFVLIGVSIPVSSLGDALVPGLILTATAVAGKLLFSWLPAHFVTTGHSALLIAVSMVPRAEVTMIILQHGRSFGGVSITPQLFGGMVLVVLITATVTPLILRPLLRAKAD